MIKDYHIHPQIIRNSANLNEFVRVALENGIEEICITDHMPLSCSSASDRIPFGKVEEYCFKGRELADKYKGKISIKLGIEVDYHPSYVKEIESVLGKGDFDFVLGSSHLHAYSDLGIFNLVSTRNEYAKMMLENTISAAQSGYFNAIAHIDMYRWIFSNPERFLLIDDNFSEMEHNELIEKTLDIVKAEDLFLEINPHFAASNKNILNLYPSLNVTERALAKGIKFSYGSDAHKPEDVGIMLKELRHHKIYGRALEVWER